MLRKFPHPPEKEKKP